jgi:hypothetical protein
MIMIMGDDSGGTFVAAWRDKVVSSLRQRNRTGQVNAVQLDRCLELPFQSTGRLPFVPYRTVPMMMMMIHLLGTSAVSFTGTA